MTFEQSLSEALDGLIPVGQGFYIMWPPVLLFALAGPRYRGNFLMRPTGKYDRLVGAVGAWIMLLLLKLLSIVRPPKIPLSSGFEFIPEPLNTVLFGIAGWTLFMVYFWRKRRRTEK